MAFGAQWLNDWEEEREDQGEDAKLSRKFEIPMAHFRTATTAPEPPPIPPPAPSLDVALRKVVTDELASVLATAWANQIADRIAAKVLALIEPT